MAKFGFERLLYNVKDCFDIFENRFPLSMFDKENNFYIWNVLVTSIFETLYLFKNGPNA